MVERYDRIEQQGRWRRLHQEDFCQALGKPPSAKYESNQTGIPGPTLPEMFAVTRNAMQAPDVVNLLDYVIFNVIACNTDAHAKNYSLMISGKGFKLAPIYDVMCGLAWEHVTRNMAQRIAGKNRGEHLKRRHWQRFAADVGLNAPRLIARVETLAKAALTETSKAAADVAAMPAGPHPLMETVTGAIEARARALLLGLTDTAGSDEDEAESPAKKSARKAKRPARAT
jgi:serine/threonine-protein kinase HipA